MVTVSEVGEAWLGLSDLEQDMVRTCWKGDQYSASETDGTSSLPSKLMYDVLQSNSFFMMNKGFVFV